MATSSRKARNARYSAKLSADLAHDGHHKDRGLGGSVNGIRVVASDRSDNVFTIGGGSSGSVITALGPGQIPVGVTTPVTVSGSDCPSPRAATASWITLAMGW